MRPGEFIEQVQTRGYMGDPQQARRATRATLQTLAEGLGNQETDDLAARLPQELADHLRHERAGAEDSFSLDEFFDRVNERHGSVDRRKAIYHARVVIEVLRYAVGEDGLEGARSRLPDEFAPLFEAGSQGGMSAER